MLVLNLDMVTTCYFQLHIRCGCFALTMSWQNYETWLDRTCLICHQNLYSKKQELGTNGTPVYINIASVT